MADRIKGELSEGGLRFIILFVLILASLLIAIKVFSPILKRMLGPMLDFLPT